MPLDTKTKYPYLHSGKIYEATDSNLCADQRKCLRAQQEFNNSGYDELDKRSALLKEMFWSVGENCFVEAPVRMNFGGNHVILGNSVYINYDFCAVDDTFITIGDYTMIGPRVVIATALHPENVAKRMRGCQYNLPVTIGKSVWIGASVTICPGVTIGDNSIIGAGAIVTKDIPANVVAFGNPCRVIRELREEDRANPAAATAE